ncbi:MAG: PmoA family protein [Daejeonella sp.]|uniref:DUF6807 domain-containing protein n=1 Tax=Daejeonella sp. TaxID=2805397 RepID=UPI002732F3D3|nr:PmoA family protein [Daejeonella sp.]MDP3467306.1 PmoA family protein [Daejeonella sp.]
MKVKLASIIIFTLIIALSDSSTAQNRIQNNKSPVIKFVKNEAKKKVDVLIDGKLFSSYWWPDTVYKPILYPLLSAAGTPVTRGFPIKAREGERRDHIHQVGNWLNYGNVNGIDFWGNGSEGKRNVKGGQIKHISIEKLSGGIGEGTMLTTAGWIAPDGNQLIAERTELHFIAKGSTRIIDRITTLTAGALPVIMKDTKEGSFGIRVARQLELPSKEVVTLTDANGQPTTLKKMSNEGVTGNYRSSEGVTGEAVWGKRAKWMDLYGNIGEEKISMVICDHPENLTYPTYWHARGYGLFAANPFGVKDFTNGKEELNYTIPAGGSLTLKYRIVISSGSHLSDAEINAFADNFASKY